MRRLALILVLLSGCVVDEPRPSANAAEPPPLPSRVTCGDRSVPSFPVGVLNQAGAVDPGDGWIRAVQTEDVVLFVAPGGGVPWSMVKVQLRDGTWNADAYGQCRLQPEIPDGVNLAVFRLAPDVELTPETTEVDLRVTETACNSGEDARGRIRVLDLVPTAESVTVLLGVVPRPGDHECPGNPETPFTLVLPEPLGDRVLLDGSSVPARDPTACPDLAVCP